MRYLIARTVVEYFAIEANNEAEALEKYKAGEATFEWDFLKETSVEPDEMSEDAEE